MNNFSQTIEDKITYYAMHSIGVRRVREMERRNGLEQTS